MKKFKNLLFVFGLFMILGITRVSAAGSGYSVSSNSSTVIVGNSVTVTVKVYSSDLGAWSYCISYDSSILKLTGSTADSGSCVKTGYVTKAGQSSSSNTFTFKALKSGSSTVTVKNAAIYSYANEQQIGGISIGSTKIKTMTQSELEATYSTNANLSSLGVSSVNESGETINYDLTPSFDKGTLSYTVTVPNEIEKVTVSASKEDKTATVSGDGEITLTEGSNLVNVVVTAQKGNQQNYELTIIREELDPISFKYNGVDYTIVRKSSALDDYVGFTATTVSYEDYDIPALTSETLNYTIVGVKDEDGNIKMFIYEDGKLIKEYLEIKNGDVIITPIGLEKKDTYDKIYEYKSSLSSKLPIEAYKLKNLYIINALDVTSGDKNYYLYNEEDGSFMVYDGSIDDIYNEKIQMYQYVIYGLIGLSAFFLLLLIFIPKGDRKAKKEAKKKKKEEKKLAKELAKAKKFVEESEEEEEQEEVSEDIPEEAEEKEESSKEEKNVEEEKEEEKFVKTAKVPVQSELKEELDIEDDLEEQPKPKTREQRKLEKEAAKRKKKEEKEQKKKAKEFDW